MEDSQKYEPSSDWISVKYDDPGSHEWPPFNGQTGINFLGGQVKVANILDGTSKTYMVGEKYLNPDATIRTAPSMEATTTATSGL